jgi:hypothetical protein
MAVNTVPRNDVGTIAHQIGRAIVGSGKECLQIPAPHSSATSPETTLSNSTSFLHFSSSPPTLAMPSYCVTDVEARDVCLGEGGRIESTSSVLILSLTPVQSSVKFGLHSFIHSSSLSYDRSKASSKASSLYSAI